jgi:hypothetical protein
MGEHLMEWTSFRLRPSAQGQMPPGEGGGSKRNDAPNEGPFRETLGCLARASGGDPWESKHRDR